MAAKLISISNGKAYAIVDKEYDHVAKQLFGDFARLNFGDNK